MKNMLIYAIRIYQRILLPYKMFTCKYCPSCSEYAIEAIRENGAMRGTIQAVQRILKCNPISKGGYDPVKECDHGF